MIFRRTFQAVSRVLLVTFTCLCAQPTIAAVQHHHDATVPQMLSDRSIDERYLKVVADIQQKIEDLRKRQTKHLANSDVSDLRNLLRQLTLAGEGLESKFRGTEQHIADLQSPPRFITQHRQIVDKYQIGHDQLRILLERWIRDEGSPEGLDWSLVNSVQFLKPTEKVGMRSPADFNKLPWRTPKRAVRAPITVSAPSDADSKSLAKGLASKWTTPSSKDLPIAPTSDDLSETEDVQITPAIQALASQLEHSPIKIYNWVRRNIEYFPSYGSIQGSDFTLQLRRGNSFDTASLLIALLRASGIPARYAYGTVQLPAAQVMNWVGGATVPEAALNLIGQGGIPSSPIISGGALSHIRLEHMWVEAWVDFVPSRGGRGGSGDTWIPLDASFKQYAIGRGMDLPSSVPFDTPAFLAAVQGSATIGTSDGSVKGLSEQSVADYFGQYRNQLRAFSASQAPNATVEAILGGLTVTGPDLEVLSGSLPYQVIAKGPKYSSLPSQLRHQFQYRLYASAFDRINDNPVWTFTRSLPSLAGKAVTLSFAAATPADANLIASYFPQPHSDGSPIQLEELPTSLPPIAHLISELRVGGQVVMSGGTFTIGDELAGTGGFTDYDLLNWDLSDDDTLVAGQTSAIGLSIQGVSAGQLNDLVLRMTQTRSKLLSGDTAGLSHDAVSGDLLTSTIWSYFSALHTHSRLVEKSSGVIDRPGLSYGLFHAAARPVKLFGTVTTSVRFTSVLMDVGHARSLRVSKSNNSAEWIAYNRTKGFFASAMESAVPDAFFSSAPLGTNGVEGASAAKALNAAALQGQRIFVVTAANLAAVLPQLNQTPHVLDDVQEAAAAGKEVVVSESVVNVGSWTGTGYAIVDPDTGAGAYLIDGHANGDETSICNSSMLALQILVITAFVIAAIAAIVVLGPAIAAGATAAAAFLAEAGAIIAAAIAAVPAAVKAAVGASLMMMVAGTASAGYGGNVTELCVNDVQATLLGLDQCVYRCPSDGFFFQIPRKRHPCDGLPAACPSLAPRP